MHLISKLDDSLADAKIDDMLVTPVSTSLMLHKSASQELQLYLPAFTLDCLWVEQCPNPK